MKYGIRYTVEVFDVYEDGSKRKRPTVNHGWQMNAWYNSMKAAKFSLSLVKDMLNENFYEVAVVNSVTIKGTREWVYTGTRFAPIKAQEHVVYHIEKYY